MNTLNDRWSRKNVFITGCTGLLGAWLAKELVNRGASVVGLVRDDVPKANFFSLGLDKLIVSVHGEIENYLLLERVLNEYEIETVFHLAAQTIVTIANNNPVSTFKANIEGTWNLLEACRKNHNVNRIIVASSDKAYGDQDVLPYSEEMPLQGSHPYDVSKSCADMIAHSYFNTYGLPVCVTRCGNFYGGGDLNFNRIVPGTIRSVFFNEKPVIRSDGSYVRDYLYILDAVDAYLCLAEKMDQHPLHGEAFNFSNEIQLTVLELTNKILELMGRKDLKPVVLGEAGSEIKKQFLSTEKTRRILGWSPRRSIEKGLQETISWYTEFFKYGKANR